MVLEVAVVHLLLLQMLVLYKTLRQHLLKAI
jgi:hypothetical protein